MPLAAFAPNFNKYPLPPNTYGTQGSNVTLMCQPEAAPTATIQWFKDGADFTASSNPQDRVALLPNGNIHFTGVTDGDGGNYTCVATNSFGTASTTGQLTILRESPVVYCFIMLLKGVANYLNKHAFAVSLSA